MSKRFLEIIRFILAGGGSFVIDYGLLFGLTEYVGWNYLISAAVAFMISLIVNYALSVYFVFESARKGRKQIFLFIVISIAGLGLNQLCMWGFVEKLGLHYMIAKIGATGIVTIGSYLTKKKALEV